MNWTESAPRATAPKRSRPRPAITHDNAFFWKGVEAGRLLLQRCRCGRLRHPPGPMCPVCHSLEWTAWEASGRGHVYSYVVAHHPAVPPFDYPNLIVLIELEEGTRIVSNLIGVDPDDVEVEMPVQAEFVELEPGRNFLQFRPAGEWP
ncbi:MAG: Zn-ribbon domain-containing OB-fold protein [Myxococcota bacterium]